MVFHSRPMFFLFLIILGLNNLLDCYPYRNKRGFSYIANETACTVDNVIYKDGDPIPTDDPCETCRCRPPGFTCILKHCEVKTGCKAIRHIGECCPSYQCGCEHNGQYYKDGERIHNAESPCYSCYCQGSSITCSLADCQFRFDCEPEYVLGECCPRYDHCPPENGGKISQFLALSSSTSTIAPIISSTINKTYLEGTATTSQIMGTTIGMIQTNNKTIADQSFQLPVTTPQIEEIDYLQSRTLYQANKSSTSTESPLILSTIDLVNMEATTLKPETNNMDDKSNVTNTETSLISDDLFMNLTNFDVEKLAMTEKNFNVNEVMATTEQPEVFSNNTSPETLGSKRSDFDEIISMSTTVMANNFSENGVTTMNPMMMSAEIDPEITTELSTKPHGNASSSIDKSMDTTTPEEVMVSTVSIFNDSLMVTEKPMIDSQKELSTVTTEPYDQVFSTNND